MSTNPRADSIKNMRFEFPDGYECWNNTHGMDKLSNEVCKCGHLRTDHKLIKHKSNCNICKCLEYRIHCYVKYIDNKDSKAIVEFAKTIKIEKTALEWKEIAIQLKDIIDNISCMNEACEGLSGCRICSSHRKADKLFEEGDIK